MAIAQLLAQILAARYGRDVRQSIHDAIGECYDDVSTAKTLATDATNSANTAATLANTKAGLADAAAINANEKATLANTKAGLADAAAINANEKAGLADTAATLANTKAGLADTAATNANTKATLADTKAGLADAAATNANEKATLASTKAGLAQSAADAANAAAVFNPRGLYNPSAVPPYSMSDIVFDNGGSYRYINDTPSNEPTSSTSHWQQIAQGTQGAPGLQGDAFVYTDFTPEQLALLKGEKGDTGATVTSAVFVGNDIVLTKDDASTVTLVDAKLTLKGDTGYTGLSAYDAAVAGGYTGTEAEFNAATAGIEAAKDAALNSAFRYPYEKVLLYYGYPIAINGAWSVEGAVSLYASYDICVLGDTYQDPSHAVYADTLAICTRLQQVSPKTKIVGYVPIGMDPARPNSNLTMAQLKQRVEQWIVLGASGIFLDEFGYDYYVTRDRQNEIVSYCHDRGLFVFANSWSTEYVFNPNPMTIDWILGFEPNPNSVAPVINENDYYLYENLFYTTRNLGTWENPNYEVTCANVWRLNDIMRYFNEARINGESYYTHYGTKLCSLDAIPSTFSAEDRMVLRSLSAIGAAILNIHAVAFGDQNWGSSGYYEHWDLPVNLNLYSESIHSVSVENRSYTPEGGAPSTFPYKWTAALGGQSWSIVFDIDTPDDVAYVYRKRYAALNGNEVINAWTTIFSFQSDVQTAVESAAQAVATCEALAEEASAVLPTVTEKIEQLSGVISGGQSDIGALLSTGQQNINSTVSAAQQAVSNANSALAAGMADLEMLSSGFNFKEVMW